MFFIHTCDSIESATLALAGATAVGAYLTFKAIRFAICPYFSPLRDLPGPENPSFILGNLKGVSDSDKAAARERWIAEYGNTLTYYTPFNVRHSEILSYFSWQCSW
jgi:hypothetical protein